MQNTADTGRIINSIPARMRTFPLDVGLAYGDFHHIIFTILPRHLDFHVGNKI